MSNSPWRFGICCHDIGGEKNDTIVPQDGYEKIVLENNVGWCLGSDLRLVRPAGELNSLISFPGNIFLNNDLTIHISSHSNVKCLI